MDSFHLIKNKKMKVVNDLSLTGCSQREKEEEEKENVWYHVHRGG